MESHMYILKQFPCVNHEDVLFQEFMMQLTQHQGRVGSVLQEGSHLITEGKVTQEEEGDIQGQMGLLNNRWEDLRVKAMDRQSK